MLNIPKEELWKYEVIEGDSAVYDFSIEPEYIDLGNDSVKEIVRYIRTGRILWTKTYYKNDLP